MKKIIFILFLAPSYFAFAGSDDYANQIIVSAATLDLKVSEIKVAAKNALKTYRWQVDKESDTSLTANLRGKGEFIVEVNFQSPDSITIKHLNEDYDRENYRYYKWLLNIRSKTMLNLTDCKNREFNRDLANTDQAIALRRNVVYAFYKYNWIIKSISESKVIAALPARGQLEADISPDGSVIFKRRDELENEYTDPLRDGYVKRVRSVFNNQQRRCAK